MALDRGELLLAENLLKLGRNADAYPVASRLIARTPEASIEQRARIDQIIMDELVNAQLLPRSLAYYVEVIRSFQDEGCDAGVLGCTEIPQLVPPESSPLPTLDSTRLLAKAAVRKAIEG